MTELYIVRHCEAEGNLYRRAQGHTNNDVTPTGWLQLMRLKERFKDIKLDAAYSSDLSRAYFTGRAVCDQMNVPVIMDRRLREVNMGVWENRTWGEIIHCDKETYKLFERDPYSWHVEGSEDYHQAADRFYNAVMDIARRHDGQKVGIFAHGSVIRAMLMKVMQLYPGEIELIPGHCDNTAITHAFVDDNHFNVDYFYDSRHLGETSTTERHRAINESRKFNVNLWFRDLNEADEEVYKKCRCEIYEKMHGNGQRGDLQELWSKALKRSKDYPGSVCIGMLKDEPAAILELAEDESSENCGRIAFMSMLEGNCRLRMGVQLIGQAVEYYRQRGKGWIGLSVSQKNEEAVGFFKYYAFDVVGEENADCGCKLLKMEKDIRRSVY